MLNLEARSPLQAFNQCLSQRFKASLIQVAHQNFGLFINDVGANGASTIAIFDAANRHDAVANGARTRHILNADDLEVITSDGASFGIAVGADDFHFACFDGALVIGVTVGARNLQAAGAHRTMLR